MHKLSFLLVMLALSASFLASGCTHLTSEPAPAPKLSPVAGSAAEADCCAACEGARVVKLGKCCEAEVVAVVAVGEVAVAAAQGADDKNWSTIKGKLIFAGDKLPEPVELKVSQDGPHCLEKGKLYGEEWVINKDNKGIRWAFVWLAPDPKGAVKELPIHPSLKEIKDKKVEIDQPRCAFVPHALALREGQILVAKNTSPVSHNVNIAGHPMKNPQQNIIIPAGQALEFKELRADERFPISVKCNIHPWMAGYVRVFDHPYFAVTNENGEFEIKNAPPGQWRLKVWHDNGWRGGAEGRDGEPITIKGGAVTDLGKLEMKPNQ